MEYLRINGVRQSMDGKCLWTDNIMIERWFRSFKFERTHSSIHHHTPAEVYDPTLLIDYVAA
jgi:putative transposase